MSRPYRDRRREDGDDANLNDFNGGLGVEICLSPRSNVDLENRYGQPITMGWTDSSSTGDSSLDRHNHHHHHRSSHPHRSYNFGAFVDERHGKNSSATKAKPTSGRTFGALRRQEGSAQETTTTSTQQQQQTRKKSKPTLFRRMIWLFLMFCVGAIIAAGIMAGISNKKNKSKTNTNASQLSNDPDGTTTTRTPTEAPVASPVTDSSPSSDGNSSGSNNGSAAPSEAPIATTARPTTMSPTPTPPTWIRPSKTSFAWGESITLSFAFGLDAEPQPDDWIGLYPADAVAADTSSLAFLFLCDGTTICGEAVGAGQVTFTDRSVSMEAARLAAWNWPLEPGNYRAFVLRGFQAPFTIVATSDPFGVEQDLMVHRVIPTVQAAQADIRTLIEQDERMGPKFVRLAFHDCAGGCDGCVDMDFHDNNGLDIPIDALQPIVDQYESSELGISRADIWAMAYLLGADVAQRRSETKVDFSLQFLGRQNCETRFSQCFDADGVERPCSTKLGPFVHLPAADITTEDLFHFFAEGFNFSVQEVVALLGAHTLGSLTREHSGFNGPNGWVRDNLLLDNDYYHELVGGEPGDDIDTLVDLAPPWLRFEVDNSDLGVANRPAWRAFPPAFDGDGTVEILMLNADVALVRELTTENMESNGRVSCSFTQRLADDSGSPRCPAAERSIQFAADYRFDNDLWLRDFEAVYKKLVNHGYNYDPSRTCVGGVCFYEDDQFMAR